jgi:heavy metal sensor kinase
VSRIPIRVRLTLAFGLAMAVVLAAVGAFLYLRLGDSLLEQLDDSLEARAAELAPLVRAQDGDVPTARLGATDDQGFAQILASDGSLLASSPAVRTGALVDGEALARLGSSASFLRRDDVHGLEGEPARLLAVPTAGPSRSLFLVVGASLEDREEALDQLLGELLIIGPVALALSSALGYLLAATALRPVETMRRRAAEVSTERPGQRLPMPRARDEIRRLGETLNAMLQRLEDGIARERRFVADASHELRTPLALLQAELELALRRPRTHDELAQALGSASGEVDRLVQLAEGLLVLARADEGNLPVRREPLEPLGLLESVARRYGPRAAREGRALSIDARTEGAIVGDRLRLEQALGNLVDNALRHGGGSVRLEVEARDDAVDLIVRDEGTGFPVEFLPRAFERFARADEVRSGGGGAGLGLAIVQAIAHAHGGTAVAANVNGAGAVVVVSLPAANQERSAG